MKAPHEHRLDAVLEAVLAGDRRVDAREAGELRRLERAAIELRAEVAGDRAGARGLRGRRRCRRRRRRVAGLDRPQGLQRLRGHRDGALMVLADGAVAGGTADAEVSRRGRVRIEGDVDVDVEDVANRVEELVVREAQRRPGLQGRARQRDDGRGAARRAGAAVLHRWSPPRPWPSIPSAFEPLPAAPVPAGDAGAGRAEEPTVPPVEVWSPMAPWHPMARSAGSQAQGQEQCRAALS